MASSWACPTFTLPYALLIILLASPSSSIVIGQAQNSSTNSKAERPFNDSIQAIFVFGDSYVDSGNNDYIKTIAKANFPPYGRDFPNHIPTGRFSNGRLITDFIASYAGIKETVPPYLDPTLTIEDLMTGVCFASANSGYDPLTAQLPAVISIQKQLDYFREYKRRLQNTIGKDKTESLIENSVFFISAGSNDVGITYFSTPFRRPTYPTLSSYLEFLFQLIEHFTLGIVEEGARNIVFAGVIPLGCAPAAITAYGSLHHHHHHRECIETLNAAGSDFNKMLQSKIKAMQNNSSAKLVYADIYKPLDDMIRHPSNYGFSFTNVGCCGTGLIEVSILCNPKSIVCHDASKFVFWDALHATEKANSIIFEALQPTVDDVLKKNI